MSSVTRLHATQDASSAPVPKGASHRCPTCERTCTPEPVKTARGVVNATRRHYANVAAEELADAFGATKNSWQQWADRLDISRQVARRFGETDSSRVTLGDVLMAPPPVALALLKSLQKRLTGIEAPPPLPPTLDETVYRARVELADVDRLLAPGQTHTLAQLTRLETEAEEAANAARLILDHTRALIAGRITR